MGGKRHSVDVAQAPLTTYTTTSHYQNHDHAETPHSAHLGFYAYSYGSWDAYTPRSWALPMPMSITLSSPSLPMTWPLACPTTATEQTSAVFVSPAFLANLKTARQRQDEHDYLFDKLRSHDGIIRRRLEHLARVDAELREYIQQREKKEAVIDEVGDGDKEKAKNKKEDKKEKAPPPKVTRGQARELRRQLWWLQHQIQQIEQDEEHLLARLGEIMADLQARQWLSQIRQQRYQQYGQQAGWLAQAVEDSVGTESNYNVAGYFDAVPSHHLPIPEAIQETTPQAIQQMPAETQPTEKAHTLTVDSSFVVSPVTPGLHAPMPASPVSDSTVSAASVASHGGNMISSSSLMSPLAPVFRSRSMSAVNQASTLASLGMHYAREEDGEGEEVFVDDDNDKETGDSDVSDTSFLPPEIRTRRVSHSSAASPTSPRQKRMSLPLVRFAWPEAEEK
ncbi:hypothetical protein SBRCBS47491_002309 [Sporothrix bragantina]|uniref:Uncharacterized protein n=1 Tax=Sporothrix bragantina TaxID=671064 RepID=A0ABP0B5X8_9PEZI